MRASRDVRKTMRNAVMLSFSMRLLLFLQPLQLAGGGSKNEMSFLEAQRRKTEMERNREWGLVVEEMDLPGEEGVGRRMTKMPLFYGVSEDDLSALQ